MSGTAILCSGQGLQGRGMFDLVADAPEADSVWKAARAALGGKDPRDLAQNGSEDELHGDKAAQVLCCAAAMALWSVLGKALARPLVVAGYSVGELAAWGVAGVPGGVRLLSGVDGNAVLSDAGRDKLADQVAQTIDWVACMEACREAGVARAIEFGPGAALSRLMREHAPDLPVHSVSEFHSLDGLKRWLAREG